MGRAYEVRKASIQKTGAAKAKLYSMYAREIYQAAKNGGTEIESNISLKRLIDKAKTDQVPSDIIKRAIDKVNSGADETYTRAIYEIFAQGGSTIIVECLTDNMNRALSDVRTVINKFHIKMGAMGSVTYMYDYLCVVSFKGLTEEDVINTLIEHNVDVSDIEVEGDLITLYGSPEDLYKIKESLSNVEFETDEITYLPKETIKLSETEAELFNKTITLFEEIDDVQNVYHNVEL